MARLKEAKRDIELTEYSNTPHGFDNPIGAPPVPAKANQSLRDCNIQEGAGGQLMNAGTKAAFSCTDECVKIDRHVGADREATEAALKEVTAFVSRVFALN